MRLLFILLLSISIHAFEEIPSSQIDFRPPVNDSENLVLPLQSNISEALKFHTEVKSQGKRGTCTIFSSIGYFESLLMRDGLVGDDIDLSEEWLEYVVMTRQDDEGSTSNRNFKKSLFFGLVSESTWPYLGVKWFTEPNDLGVMAQQRCGELRDTDYFMSCLLGHRDPRLLRESDTWVKNKDPEFFEMREEARAFKATYLKRRYSKRSDFRMDSVSQVKRMLLKNYPVILGLKLYYGSWNSSKTELHDIQPRNKNKWFNGIVGYPAPGSRDRRISGEKGGGHSILVVGYDDSIEITNKLLMDDGTYKEVKTTGAYLIKNSWGQKGFGKNFTFKGQSLPGFGWVSQEYANELGTFYSLVR
tara:strand:- start:18534 stop:19610 length:1077 start_codon:yes stop_codon:yes gene_type:complete